MIADEELQRAILDFRSDRDVEGAFSVISNRFSKRVGRWLPAWLSEEEREDLTQSTLIRVYEKRKLFPGQLGAFQAYLHRVAKSEFVNWRRRNMKQPRTEDLNTSDPPDHRMASPERTAAAREAISRLEAALDALSPRQRQVAMLRLQGQNTQEIAELLQIPRNTAKSNLAHARKRLRHMFENVLIDLGNLDDD